MKNHIINNQVSVSDQIQESDLQELANNGVDILLCNRPDGESADQPSLAELASAAKDLGLDVQEISFKSGEMNAGHVDLFKAVLSTGRKLHAFCRTGNRSLSLYTAAALSAGAEPAELQRIASATGFDMSTVIAAYSSDASASVAADATTSSAKPSYDVVIVGAGSGGIAAAASIRSRNHQLRIVVIDPAKDHYYQPGWTMVGGGVFDAPKTHRDMQSVIPHGVSWLRHAVVGFKPSVNEVVLDSGQHIHYKQLVVSPGLVLDWDSIEGLRDTLGKNGVTSNYLYDLAPYTWELVKSLKKGKALFTQPPMPIKCAGAPQKAMYLSCDHWLKSGVLNSIDVGFANAGGVLFGVADYVPALQSYVDKYNANLHFNHNLIRVDGEQKVAYFKASNADGEAEEVAMEFDMLHVCPPQKAPAFIAESDLSDAAGWLDVDQYTLRHKQFNNIWGLGDVMNTPNAKTMAAVRKQVPVVAQNLVDVMAGMEPGWGYDGYGSCPLTVENGKIVLAEFGYGGKLQPSFPQWLLKGTQPTRAAWILKANLLPTIYWQAMLKGREWLASPKHLEDVKS